jgi:predicted GNAT family N-acyltransferase
MSRLSSATRFTVSQVGWEMAGCQLRDIRQRVFMAEQQVPEALEWDGLDEHAIHLLASDERGIPVGCARILDGGIVGRMAVIQEMRALGIGRAFLDAAISVCRNRGWHVVTLSAQTHAIPFYERAGFKVCSEEYMDAGIPHRDMRLELSA